MCEREVACMCERVSVYICEHVCVYVCVHETASYFKFVPSVVAFYFLLGTILTDIKLLLYFQSCGKPTP